MSNHRTRLNRLVTSIRRQSAAAQLGLAPELGFRETVEFVACVEPTNKCLDLTDAMLSALGVVEGSRRAFALRCAQDAANRDRVPYAVYENDTHLFRTVPCDGTDNHPGSGWALIERVEPQ